MKGAGAVTALVLLEATTGLVAGAAWTQSWSIVRRGHFRICAWAALGLGVLATLATRESFPSGAARGWCMATAAGAALYLLLQFSRTDVPAVVAGVITSLAGATALVVSGGHITGWPEALAALALLIGAALIGAVTNGMLLGHWYLNQPGLKPWALARLSAFALLATVAALLVGLICTGRLAGAETPGAALGLAGFGESFGVAFFVVWLGLIALTGVVSAMARRCVTIRSIQSATGLFYVALLTAVVSEFLVRYLMLNATTG